MAMIAGPGHYSARDLIRLGTPVSLMYIVIVVVMVNVLF